MRGRLLSIYREMSTEYRLWSTGRKTQDTKLPDWWPADSPYEVMVGAILAQNTNWKNVEKAIVNLKEANALDPKTILETGNSKLETLIRSSGFYRQKAKRLKLATQKWLAIRKLETQNRKLKTAELREAWLSVKGIGKETADSILLYAFNRPIFVIDAYTRRFCKHHDLFESKEYDDYRLFFESNLPRSVILYKRYHGMIVEWGKSVSRSRS